MTRKSNGDGSVFQRADGRWVAALQVGFEANGTADILKKVRQNRDRGEAKTQGTQENGLSGHAGTAQEADGRAVYVGMVSPLQKRSETRIL
jgi:hypothetical protein